MSLNRAYFSFRSSGNYHGNVHGSASRAARFTTLRIPRIYDVPCKNDKVSKRTPGVGTNERTNERTNMDTRAAIKRYD